MNPNDCPFCGSGELSMGGITHNWVSCECGAEGPADKDREEAVRFWNAPTDEIDRLEDEVKDLTCQLEAITDELDSLEKVVESQLGIMRLQAEANNEHNE